jgi:hypothetical protein
VLPFWISIALLSLAQGAVVALARAPDATSLRALPAVVRAAGLSRSRARGWAALPPASVLVFVLVAGAAQQASAQTLTYVALVGVPLLALLALRLSAPRARAGIVVPVLALFALAWVDRGGLAAEAAALVLSALSCVALGTLLAWVTPPRWLAAGILAMAAADTALVVSDLLRKPNDALNAAHPAAGLPRLQSAVLGSAVIGYGDLFAAAALGALIATSAGRSLQRRAAVLTALLALCLDLLFFFVDELPATVPVALTLILLSAQGRLASVWRGRARASAAPPRPRRPGPVAAPPRALDPRPSPPRDQTEAAR